MTGLEKITSRILENARAEAQEILDEATEQSLQIRAENLANLQATQNRLFAEAEKEGEALVIRAKSSAAMTRRNIELSAKSEMIELAFSKAMQEIFDMAGMKLPEYLGTDKETPAMDAPASDAE